MLIPSIFKICKRIKNTKALVRFKILKQETRKKESSTDVPNPLSLHLFHFMTQPTVTEQHYRVRRGGSTVWNPRRVQTSL